MSKHIYADNAATTKLDLDAFEAMKPYLIEEYGNASQPYSFSKVSKKALKEARSIIASCINASPEEIYFTSGGTESDNWAIKGCMKYGDSRCTITSNIEHHAVLNACKSVESMGYPVVYLSSDKKGVIRPETLESIITPNTKLVSIMMANNEIGTIEPIKELAVIAHKNGALMHTDAVQAIGHIPIDVKDLQVDMLSASAHKFNGPKGIGFLYIKNGTQIKPFADGGSQEFGMRAGTENIPAIVGMAIALKNNIQHMEKNTNHLNKLVDVFYSSMSNSKVDYLINGSVDTRLPGNINISLKNKSGEGIMHMLDLKGIFISTGSACDSKNQQVSHVIKAINIPREYAEGTIRITFSKDNTEDDVISLVNTLIKVVNIGA